MDSHKILINYCAKIFSVGILSYGIWEIFHPSEIIADRGIQWAIIGFFILIMIVPSSSTGSFQK
jgi:hypothetical protein